MAEADHAEIDIDDDIDAPKKGLTGKKIVLFIVLPILLLGGRRWWIDDVWHSRWR